MSAATEQVQFITNGNDTVTILINLDTIKRDHGDRHSVRYMAGKMGSDGVREVIPIYMAGGWPEYSYETFDPRLTCTSCTKSYLSSEAVDDSDWDDDYASPILLFRCPHCNAVIPSIKYESIGDAIRRRDSK